MAAQSHTNKVVSTQSEQQLDREIRTTINRNLIRQQQIAYMQALRRQQQRKKRFGLKFR